MKSAVVGELKQAELFADLNDSQLEALTEHATMQMGKARGNRLLNEELAKLVQEKLVAPEDAVSKAADKADLMDKLKAINMLPA